MCRSDVTGHVDGQHKNESGQGGAGHGVDVLLYLWVSWTLTNRLPQVQNLLTDISERGICNACELPSRGISSLTLELFITPKPLGFLLY